MKPMFLLWLAALRRGPSDRAPWLLAWLGFGPIVLFVAIADDFVLHLRRRHPHATRKAETEMKHME